jgi:glycosyltransferase involved in cell wall biosynthesis
LKKNRITIDAFLSKHIPDKLIKWVNKSISIRALKKNDYDVFHPTWYDPYFFNYCRKPIITTIHDMIHEKFNNSSEKTINKKKYCILNSTKLIAVSETTKKEILNLYDVDPDKISVIYHGAPMIKSKYLPNIWGKYILFVGTRVQYKNFNRFIQAMSLLLFEDKNLKIICVGKPFNHFEVELLKKSGIENRVFSQHVDDITLDTLYHYAQVFVYPSLYEGFGIPILEAFSNGCPCCISESSCFPEVAQNAAMYFNPEDIHSIYTSVKKILLNNSLQNDLKERGNERLKFFSWKKSANEIKEIYQSVI